MNLQKALREAKIQIKLSKAEAKAIKEQLARKGVNTPGHALLMDKLRKALYDIESLNWVRIQIKEGIKSMGKPQK